MQGTKTNVESGVINVTTTFLSFDREKVVSQLKNIPYIAENFPELFSYVSEYHENEFWENKSYVTIYDQQKVHGSGNGYQTLNVEVEQIRHHYNTPNQISITFSGLKKSTLNQDAIYDAVKVVIPELAEYLVYGEDADFRNGMGNVVSNGSELIEFIGENNYSYAISRSIWDNGDEIEVDFRVFVYRNDYEDTLSYNFADESNLYQATGFTPEVIFSKNYPTLTPFVYEDFSNVYFGDILTNIGRYEVYDWGYYDFKQNENTQSSHMDISLFAYDKDGAVAGSLDYKMDTVSVQDDLNTGNLEISMYTYGSLNKDVDVYAHDCITKISSLVDNLTSEELIVDENDNTVSTCKVACIINGVEWSGHISVDYKTSCTTLYLHYGV